MIFKIIILSLCFLSASLIVLSKNKKIQVAAFTFFNLSLAMALFDHDMQFMGLIYGASSMSFSLVLMMFFMKPTDSFIREKKEWGKYFYKIFGVISVMLFVGLMYQVLKKDSLRLEPVSVTGQEGEMISQLFNEYYFPFGFIAFSILAVIYSIVIYLEGKK